MQGSEVLQRCHGVASDWKLAYWGGLDLTTPVGHPAGSLNKYSK